MMKKEDNSKETTMELLELSSELVDTGDIILITSNLFKDANIISSIRSCFEKDAPDKERFHKFLRDNACLIARYILETFEYDEFFNFIKLVEKVVGSIPHFLIKEILEEIPSNQNTLEKGIDIIDLFLNSEKSFFIINKSITEYLLEFLINHREFGIIELICEHDVLDQDKILCFIQGVGYCIGEEFMDSIIFFVSYYFVKTNNVSKCAEILKNYNVQDYVIEILQNHKVKTKELLLGLLLEVPMDLFLESKWIVKLAYYFLEIVTKESNAKKFNFLIAKILNDYPHLFKEVLPVFEGYAVVL